MPRCAPSPRLSRIPAGAVAAVATAVDETDAKREAKVLEHTIPYWKSKETEVQGFGWQTEQGWRDTIDVASKAGPDRDGAAARRMCSLISYL